MVMYAGVDYQDILRQAEQEAHVIIWDGGNNDFPFCAPDLLVTVVDPLRPGHELAYYPASVSQQGVQGDEVVAAATHRGDDRRDVGLLSPAVPWSDSENAGGRRTGSPQGGAQ